MMLAKAAKEPSKSRTRSKPRCGAFDAFGLLATAAAVHAHGSARRREASEQPRFERIGDAFGRVAAHSQADGNVRGLSNVMYGKVG